MEKLIITLASTGNVPTKALNPNSPLSVNEIVSDFKSCEALGVSIAHIHVRDENELPTSDRKIFEKIQQEFKSNNLKLITQFSTGARGGANSMDLAWRSQMLDLRPEMGSLATGSSNFPNSINANSPELVEGLAKIMFEFGIKPEIEVFDLAMIDNAIRLEKKGLIKSPLHFNLVMNVPGSIPGTPKNLMFLIESLPKGSTWTVSGIGPSQVQMITMAIALGGHVRTGLEDTLYYEKGILATNAMLVERVVRISNAVGRAIATPDEAREMLALL